MTVQQAANLLIPHLAAHHNVPIRPSWLVAIGIGVIDGADCIYVYTKGRMTKEDLRFFAGGWHGFKVVVKATEEFKPTVD